MAGNQCSDFGGTSIPSSQLCLMPEGHPYAGLVTYRDGRAASLAPNAGDTPVFLNPNGTAQVTLSPSGIDLNVTRRMQGTEIGDCGVPGANSTYLPLQTVAADGTRVTWDPEHLRVLYRAMNQGSRESGNALFCSNRETGGLAINRFAGDKIRNAINALQADHSGLDEAHYRIALQQLQQMGGVADSHRSPSWFEWLLFGVFAFQPLHVFYQYFFVMRPARTAYVAARNQFQNAELQRLRAQEAQRQNPSPENQERLRQAEEQSQRAREELRRAARAARERGVKDVDDDPPPPAAGVNGGNGGSAPANQAANQQSQAMMAIDPELAAGLSVLDDSYGLVPNGPSTGVRTYLTLDQIRVEGTPGATQPGQGTFTLPGQGVIRIPNLAPIFEGAPMPGLRLAPRLR